jgi:hypothetical protein
MTATDEVAMVTGGFRVGRNAWLCIAASWGFGVLEIRCSERLPAVRPTLSMTKTFHLRSTLAPGRRR